MNGTESECALLVELEAKPGKEAEVEAFLRGGLPLAKNEPDTTAWFAFRFDESTFGIFDTFPDEQGRRAHLQGQIAAALEDSAEDLLAEPPRIEEVDVIEAKHP